MSSPEATTSIPQGTPDEESEALKAALGGVSSAFASLGRVFFCVDSAFNVLHASSQLDRMLGTGGFDAQRDLLAITVNRWPHGYAREPNTLWDAEWEEGDARPWEIGRQRHGRIAIANADAGASAYTDAAIDQAHRAVDELLAG